MTVPTDKKDRAVYHTILSDMHRLEGMMLNLQTVEANGTERAVREHFGREQTVILGRLSEWRARKPDLYRQAGEDFQRQRFQEVPGSGSNPSGFQ